MCIRDRYQRRVRGPITPAMETGGKMKKTKPKQRHDPLDKDIRAQHQLQGDERKYKLRKARANNESDKVPSALSKKIAEQAMAQQEEVAAENTTEGLLAGGSDDEELEDYDEADELEEEVEEIEFNEFDGEMEVSAADQAAMAMFMGAGQQQVRLSDIIMEKIREKEQGVTANASQEPGLDPKIVEVYQSIGKMLHRYKSGKLPKAFKIIPSLANWEEILYLTDPDQWSPHTYFAATRMFVIRPVKVFQRFLNLVLLPKVRDDIADPVTKGLNYHLYMAIKKAMFKPAAFYKGFLLPLAETGCSLNESWIIASILSKVSIRLLDSAAALLKLAEMDYTPSTSMFMRTLLAKKYALPYSVLDALTSHYMRFMGEQRTMPVMWHQSLLVYCQHYKQDLTLEEKELLKELLKRHYHPTITPEIRRELFFGRSRGEAAAAPDAETSLMEMDV
eukprot:TRINITY_DN2395_c0_g1_i5.p1 TRINITY_DN2395_c0_g1~~TRINITY_DN2395_c0_g1_i5.p1  ORF type:complete len:448 (+),score=146.34 TRINITY_DN2395_c0_g1_i5:160-1503(+)